MRSAFDGLHAILGNSAAAVPEVAVTAVEAPVEPLPVRLDPPSTSKELASHPGLSDLDRGLFTAGDTTSNTNTAAALDALDHGLDSGLFTGPPVRAARQSSPTFSMAPAAEHDVDRQVSGWAAAAVMTLGLLLGATAAIALFHDDVSHIVASWDGASSSARARR
jgi:hypothetical protein